MSAALWTSGKPRPLTKANGIIITMPRALWVGIEGTANFLDENGALVEDFPLFFGLNPIKITSLREGGSAANIWGLY